MKYQKYLDSLSIERKYCLLDRMRIDCEYFLGFGARHEKYLWAGNVKEQIESMLYLYDSIMQKPHTLSVYPENPNGVLSNPPISKYKT